MTLQNLAEKIDRLIQENGKDCNIACMLWTPEDIEDHFNEILPEEEPITDEEIQEALYNLEKNKSAETGLPQEAINGAAPQSVKDRLI